jgi:hypothetical protein
LRAESERERVAIGLFKVVQNVLIAGIALRIFDRGIHAREHAHIVKSALNLTDLVAGYGIAGMQGDAG